MISPFDLAEYLIGSICFVILCFFFLFPLFFSCLLYLSLYSFLLLFSINLFSKTTCRGGRTCRGRCRCGGRRRRVHHRRRGRVCCQAQGYSTVKNQLFDCSISLSLLQTHTYTQTHLFNVLTLSSCPFPLCSVHRSQSTKRYPRTPVPLVSKLSKTKLANLKAAFQAVSCCVGNKKVHER